MICPAVFPPMPWRRLVGPFLFLALAGQTTLFAQEELAPAERRIAGHVDDRTPAAVALLESTVNQNSGTLNHAGVRAVYDMMAPQFEELGFEVRWVQMPSETGRSGHLVAERKGSRGKSLLLIGHLDTVFEPDSPFQTWVRVGDFATGPGAVDMKGGNIVILLALQALHDEGVLEDVSITVVMTGDEEASGRPLEVVRRDLFLAGERADIALGFENASRSDGVDLAIVARRSWSSWLLEVKAASGHSSLLFRDEIGTGAIYEAARILDTFYEELRGEQYLTFNVGVLLGGTQVSYDAAQGGGTADGKNNVIPQAVIATGDIRAMTVEQLERTRDRMRQVVTRSLTGAQATITFDDDYPAMPPAPANYALLEQYSEISRALGFGAVQAIDPGARGAADIAFVAGTVEAALDGLGPVGEALHTVNERLEVTSVPTAAKRAAILIHRLTR